MTLKCIFSVIRIFQIVIFEFELTILICLYKIFFFRIFVKIIFSLAFGRPSHSLAFINFWKFWKIENFCNLRWNAGEISCVRGVEFLTPEAHARPLRGTVIKPRHFFTNCLNFHRKIFSVSLTIEKKLTEWKHADFAPGVKVRNCLW